MSCIPKLLEKKGDNKIFKLHGGSNLETGGSYEGYDYCITINHLGHYCGYVAVPANHYFAMFKETWNLDLDVHGGVTFYDSPNKMLKDELKTDCDDIWIGFDAGHAEDLSDFDKLKEVFPEYANEEIINDLHKLECIFSIKKSKKTIEYMEEQCRFLIEQIKAKDK